MRDELALPPPDCSVTIPATCRGTPYDMIPRSGDSKTMSTAGAFSFGFAWEKIAMQRFACARRLSALALTAAVIAAIILPGCADNSMVLKGRLDQFQQQQLASSRQQQQLQGRASALDADNQELSELLGQSQQRSKLLEDQVAALNDQLRGVTSQLAEAQAEKSSSNEKVRALTASLRRRGGVSIMPNNSLLQTMPAINLPDVYVRRDGDVIRVELPGGQLFESGSARLRPGGASLISNAAAELLASYPRQIIGIEGHTDSDRITSDRWRNNHELSVARSIAVYDVLTNRTQLRPEQLFVVGHGPNHPVVSNATIDGKQRNRRVELVVYPEKAG